MFPGKVEYGSARAAVIGARALRAEGWDWVAVYIGGRYWAVPVSVTESLESRGVSFAYLSEVVRGGVSSVVTVPVN